MLPQMGGLLGGRLGIGADIGLHVQGNFLNLRDQVALAQQP